MSIGRFLSCWSLGILAVVLVPIGIVNLVPLSTFAPGTEEFSRVLGKSLLIFELAGFAGLAFVMIVIDSICGGLAEILAAVKKLR
jgi:hypothetical protein